MLSEAEIRAKLQAAKDEQERAISAINQTQAQINTLNTQLTQMFADLNALLGKIDAYTIILSDKKADAPPKEE